MLKSNNTINKYSTILTKKMSDSDIVATIQQRRTWFNNSMYKTRRQWLINSAFSRGNQFSVLSSTADRLIQLQEPPGRKQVTDDMISPWKEHMVANLTTAMPQGECIPSNTDAQAASAARMGSKLLSHYWSGNQFIFNFINLCCNILDFGNVFIYLDLLTDSTQYQSTPVYDSGSGQQAVDIEGRPLSVLTKVNDINMVVLPPHNVFCPLDPTPIEDKPWMAIQQKKELGYYPQQYGKKGDEVAPEEIANVAQYDIESISANVSGIGDTARQEYANEIIYFQKPCDANPEGMVVVIAGKTLLRKGIWEYSKLQTYPIEHFHYPKENGEFFARSRIERQIPLQKMLNLIWSIVAENIDDMAHIKWLIPRQAEVTTPVNQTEVIRYNAPNKPEQSQLMPIPAHIFNSIDMLKNAIRDVQSYHGASMGTSVSGVRSDLHAQNLQDQDLLPLQTVDNLMKASFERLGEKILLIASEKLADERLLSYIGKDNRVMIENFRGSMLGDTQKVRVRMTNTWARSKTAVSQRIMELAQYGLMVDKQGRPDTTRIMKLLEFALPESEYDEYRIHSERASQENEKLMRGEPVPVLPWQDHQVYIAIREEFMNSPEFMELFETQAPENQQVIDRFVENLGLHQKAFAQAQAQALVMLQPPTEPKGEPQRGTAKQ